MINNVLCGGYAVGSQSPFIWLPDGGGDVDLRDSGADGRMDVVRGDSRTAMEHQWNSGGFAEFPQIFQINACTRFFPLFPGGGDCAVDIADSHGKPVGAACDDKLSGFVKVGKSSGLYK